MKIMKKALSILLVAMMIASCISVVSVSAGEVDNYYQSLIAKGFPSSYAKDLTNLHMVHPDWEFVPLDVTGISQQQGKTPYTWDYVISQEYSGHGEDNNLVYPSSTYKPYRKNSNTYDSGWWPASQTALKFIMDPRNFLNERNIFMFMDLYYGDSDYTVADIEGALAGSFMANKIIPDSGNTLTYAQYFLQLGKSNNVNPIFLAARLRQEQGAGTSPLISGSCGTTLYNYYSSGTNGAPSSGYSYSSLIQYNGYYNYFNMGAAGNGYFYIYLNGMKEAKTNGWTSHKAAIAGGSANVKTKYLDRYQSTIYLQKFNVDARSMKDGSCINFWGQYMQNFSAPYSEGRTIQKALADNLDIKIRFLIPVYSGMPSSPVGDPGSYFSGEKYSYINTVDIPSSASSGSGPAEIYCTVNADTQKNLTVSGWSVTTKGISGYFYSVDHNSKWNGMATTFRQDVYDSVASAGYSSCSDYNAFTLNLDVSGLSGGDHVVVIKGLTDALSSSTGTQSYPIAVINLHIETELDDAHFTLDDPPSASQKTVELGDTLYTKGWALVPSGVTNFALHIDGNVQASSLPAFRRDDVLNAFPDLAAANANLHGFSYDIPTDNLTPGAHKAEIIVTAASGLTFTMATFNFDVVLANDYSFPVIDGSSYADTMFDYENILRGVSEGSSALQVAENIDAACKIYDFNGNLVTSGKVCSGYTIEMYIGVTRVKSAILIVDGDFDGDGAVTAKDVIRTKKAIYGGDPKGYLAAADCNADGSVTKDDLKTVSELSVSK